MRDHWSRADLSDVEAFMRGFLRALGDGAPSVATLPPEAKIAGRNLMTEAPWLTSIPATEIARAPFPKLLISADWSAAFNAICDRLAEQWHGVRQIFPGAGHAVQRIGAPFNALLESFISGNLK
jgi:hypothetical protein